MGCDPCEWKKMIEIHHFYNSPLTWGGPHSMRAVVNLL